MNELMKGGMTLEQIINLLYDDMDTEDDSLVEEYEILEEKEIKAKTHLEDMFEITRNLSYDDIRLLKKNKENKESGRNINIERQWRKYSPLGI